MSATPLLNDDTYQYSRLEAADSIRLLRLQPSTDDPTVVSCTIEHSSLARPPPYYALSYSWGMNEDGDASLCRTISINGRSKAVTRNLYEGLLRLRARYAGEPFWIDAVCIDQDHDKERTAQVSIMAKIYRRARQVLVWLGEGKSDEDNRTAFQALRCFALGRKGHLKDPDGTPSEDDDHRVRNAEGRTLNVCFFLRKPKRWFKDFDGIEALTDAWDMVRNGIEGLRKGRLFSRRWVMQEMYFGTAPMLCRGDQTLLFEQCSQGLQNFMSIQGEILHVTLSDEWADVLPQIPSGKGVPSYDFGSEAVSSLLSMANARKTAHGDLIKAMENAGGHGGVLECSDARDYLYALLSIDEECVVPDYSLSVAAAYTMFAELLIARGRARLLFTNSIGKHVDGTLPSWVPDLRQKFFSGPANHWGSRLDANLEASSLGDGKLSCKLLCLGKLQEVSDMHKIDPRGAQYAVKIHAGSCVILSNWIIEPLFQMSGWSVEVGDELLSAYDEWMDSTPSANDQRLARIQILRPVLESLGQRYKILSQAWLKSPSALHSNNDEDCDQASPHEPWLTLKAKATIKSYILV